MTDQEHTEKYQKEIEEGIRYISEKCSITDPKKFIYNYMSERKSILQFDPIEGEGWFVSKHFSVVDLPTAYHMTADFLIQTSREEEMEEIIVWPVIFLYRHAVELYLKKAITYANSQKNGHNILKLYYHLIDKLEDIEKEFCSVHPHVSLCPSEDVFSSIMEFHSISPQSTELRYEDLDLIGGQSHPLFANFRYAEMHTQRIKEYVDSLYEQLRQIGFKSHAWSEANEEINFCQTKL